MNINLEPVIVVLYLTFSGSLLVLCSQLELLFLKKGQSEALTLSPSHSHRGLLVNLPSLPCLARGYAEGAN